MSHSRVRLFSLPLVLLILSAVLVPSALAQDVAVQLRDWVQQLERDNLVNPLITFASVAAAPDRFHSTKAVRVSGWVRDVVPAEDGQQAYASLASDCGAQISLHTWQHRMLVKGMRIRAVVPAPLQGYPTGPVIALAWAPESVFGGNAGGGLVPGSGPSLYAPQPGMDPNVASGRRTIRAMPSGGGSTYYGVDQLTGLAYYGAPQPQQPAYTGMGWSHSGATAATPSTYQTSDVTQFAAYANLARYFNPALTVGESQAIVSALFEGCARYGVPRPLMAALIYAESCYKPLCKSHAGAMGLCQLMPGTARGLGVTSPYEVRQNVLGGTKYLADMLRRFQGRDATTQIQLALASYNAGPGAVDRAGGIPKNRETPPHVAKVVRTYQLLLQKGYR